MEASKQATTTFFSPPAGRNQKKETDATTVEPPAKRRKQNTRCRPLPNPSAFNKTTDSDAPREQEEARCHLCYVILINRKVRFAIETVNGDDNTLKQNRNETIAPYGVPGHHHLANGARLISAGTLKLNEAGKIIFLDNRSGKFRPSMNHLLTALETLGASAFAPSFRLTVYNGGGSHISSANASYEKHCEHLNEAITSNEGISNTLIPSTERTRWAGEKHTYWTTLEDALHQINGIPVDPEADSSSEQTSMLFGGGASAAAASSSSAAPSTPPPRGTKRRGC